MNNRTKRLLMLLEDGGRKTVSGVPPLIFKSDGSALKNYRIYGNTVNGESVGDRTGNLFANLWKKGYIRADNGREEQIDGFICSGFFPVEYGQTYSISRNINAGYDNVRGYRDDGSFIGAGSDVCDVSNPFPSAATNIGVFTVTNENVAFIRFNDSANDLGMKYMIVKGTYTEQTMPDYEPYGYRVPVTIEGKNLLQNTASSQTKNGVTFTVNNDGSVTCNGTASNNTLFKIGDLSLASQSYILTGCPSNGGKYSYTLRGYENGNIKGVDDGNGVNINKSIDGYIEIRIASGYTCDNLTFYPMIRKANIKDDTYEPYHAPITTNLYLPEQIKMVGNDAEYVDFVEQKQYFADGTSVDVELPALPILSGTNTLSVGTTVQPSKVEVMGKIKAVSAQPVLLSRQISDSLMFGSENELDEPDSLLFGSENGPDEPHQSAALTASPVGKPSFDVSEQLKGDDEYADDQSGYSSDENDLRDNSENTDDFGSDSEVGRESTDTANTD